MSGSNKQAQDVVIAFKQSKKIFSTGQHTCTVLSVEKSKSIRASNMKLDGDKLPKPDYYAIATDGPTGPDIYRNAVPVTKDENGKDIPPSKNPIFLMASTYILNWKHIIQSTRIETRH